jgi:L-rhamnose-H+ transport protein
MTTGCLLIILAALMNASFAMPMKQMPRWSWENVWLLWSIFSLIILPWTAAFLTIPNLFGGYVNIGLPVLTRVILFGSLWGVAQVLFGLSVVEIGMALTFSIVLGLSSAVGTVIPFLVLHHNLLGTKDGALIVAGILFITFGMTLFAKAGSLRERERGEAPLGMSKVPFRRGMILAAVSGFCASFMNLGLSFAGSVLRMASDHGSRPFWQVNAVWPLLLLGGAVPNLLYCSFLLMRNQTSTRFVERGTALYTVFCFGMATLWFGSSLLFGIATFQLGTLGGVIGWPMFMALIVIAASVFGWLSGEWKGGSRRPLRLQCAGIAILSVAIILLSRVGA